MVVDLFLVYQFIRRLATPFNKWDAYKLGIIDDAGKVLIKKKDLTTSEQKKAWGVFDILVANIKKLLAKVPGGSSRLASYAAALFLIKEWNHFSDSSLLTEDTTEKEIDESLLLFSSVYLNYIKEESNVKALLEKKGKGPCWDGYKQVGTKMKNGKEVPNCVPENEINLKPELDEEVPVNSVGGGNIAGFDGKHMSKAAQKRWTSQNKSKKKTFKDMRGVLNQ